MKKIKKEEIHWDDAYHLSDTWISKEEIMERYREGACKIINIGWVIYEDKKYILMTAKRDDSFGNCGFVIMIPKGMITKRIKL